MDLRMMKRMVLMMDRSFVLLSGVCLIYLWLCLRLRFRLKHKKVSNDLGMEWLVVHSLFVRIWCNDICMFIQAVTMYARRAMLLLSM
mmetsp:Transcript_26630/g.39504  ORF Transcript_26630/g.39504 Transcript_26630/m.39504 type:complete len:87 (+) Transcript_26630:655-915(+)